MAMSLRFEFVNLMKSDQQNLVQKVISESASNVIQQLLPLSNVLIKVHADEKLVIPEYLKALLNILKLNASQVYHHFIPDFLLKASGRMQ